MVTVYAFDYPEQEYMLPLLFDRHILNEEICCGTAGI
jgi:hypothetical protein